MLQNSPLNWTKLKVFVSLNSISVYYYYILRLINILRVICFIVLLTLIIPLNKQFPLKVKLKYQNIMQDTNRVESLFPS